MTTITVWAETGDIHGNVCADARLREEDGETLATKDSPRGQAGWDVGIRYKNNFHDLVTQLSEKTAPPNGKIRRLAIHAHGLSGEVYVNGEKQPPLSAANLGLFKKDLERLQSSLAPDAVVVFVGCVAGQGEAGDKLLMEVSRLLPGRKVVAFETIGYAPGGEAQTRPGEDCTEPGMRDTEALSPSPKGSKVQLEREALWAPMWNHLALLPWASEHSSHAVVARNGIIIQQRPYRPEAARKREEAVARIPRKPQGKHPKGRAPLPLMVDLTQAEEMVYAFMDPSPISIEALIGKTGLHRLQVEQAARSLSAKMLIRWIGRGESAGYVQFLNRYVG